MLARKSSFHKGSDTTFVAAGNSLGESRSYGYYTLSVRTYLHLEVISQAISTGEITCWARKYIFRRVEAGWEHGTWVLRSKGSQGLVISIPFVPVYHCLARTPLWM